MQKPKLTDLIDVGILQKIQDGFSNFTGMAALITNENGTPVTKGSGFSDFCMHFTRQSELGRRRCEECDRQGALTTLENGKPTVYQCHAGLVDYAVPIMVEGRFIGSFIGGQISTKPIDMEQIRQNAQELGLDAENYVEAARRILLLDQDEVNRAAEFLYLVGSILSDMAYKSNEELKKSQKLERAAKSQAAFIMDMNTEFQQNMTEWLETAKEALGTKDTAVMEETIKQLLIKGPTLLSNFSDTVEYAKMTDGKIELNETEYNIENLLQFVCDNIESRLGDKAVVIIRQVDDNVPSRLLGDQGRLGQIISKLLANAVQYTEEGVIDIHVSSEVNGYAEDLTIQIADTGVGMSPENYKYVNNYLKYGDTKLFDRQEGKEIGLSMVSFLVKQMSGSIAVESTQGKGTTFTVRLPQLKLSQ